MNSESSFIETVHKGLRCYAWKIHTTIHKGKLDCYYGEEKSLWIEYKFLPPNRKTIELSKKPFLSKLQQYEIKTLVKHNQTVRIIVGTPRGGYIFEPKDIHMSFRVNELPLHSILTIQQLIHKLTKTPNEPP